MAMTTCSRCGSTEIDSGRLISAGDVLYHSARHTYAFLKNQTAYVCLNCGYTELYVNPEYIEKIKNSEPE